MDGITADYACYPEAGPTNKLAAARAKAIKNNVRDPFPVMELADHLPSAFEVSALCFTASP